MIEFNLQKSRIYQYLIIVVYALSAVMITLLSISLLLKGVLLIVLTAYMARVMWIYCLLKAHASIQSLRFISDKKWVVVAGGAETEAELSGDSTVTRWVSVLQFKIAGQRRPVTCILFVDSLPAELYRKLLVAVQS